MVSELVVMMKAALPYVFRTAEKGRHTDLARVTVVVPGHDPLVLTRYPAAKAGLEGWVVRLDVDPRD